MDSIIKITNLKKIYKLYDNKQDRLKEVLSIRHKSYHRDFRALNDISFDVKKGETVGIIGTNGSGKSTLLKIITGVLAPTDGEVEVNGRISALLELGTGFNPEYTGMENIYLNGRMMGYDRKEMEGKVSQIVEFADIGDFIYQPVKTYSSGMFARLAFAVAINVEPDILIVDEALSVGDLFFQNKCFRKFEELREKGVTILFVSHDISSVRQMCSRVLWIEKGVQKIFDESDKVCDVYMDTKRQGMNELSTANTHEDTVYLNGVNETRKAVFPKVTWKEANIISDKVIIESVFITDEKGKTTNRIEVDRKYAYHVVTNLKQDMTELIFGVVVENNKGIPLYDFNNYINSGKVVQGKKGETIEVCFEFVLPRIMRGSYSVSAAIAQGKQDQHIMLTWLHGVQLLEVINSGYNSSYIEIPANVEMHIYDEDNVEYRE